MTDTTEPEPRVFGTADNSWMMTMAAFAPPSTRCQAERWASYPGRVDEMQVLDQCIKFPHEDAQHEGMFGEWSS